MQVTDGAFAVHAMNELEWVSGEVWANIWQTDCIARIDPSTGTVKCVPATTLFHALMSYPTPRGPVPCPHDGCKEGSQ